MAIAAKKRRASASASGETKAPVFRGLPKSTRALGPATSKSSIKRVRASAPEEFKSSVLTIRVKEQLKADATAILAEIGISLPEAVRVFLSRIVRDGGFPFRLEVPNATTIAAMEEARHLSGRFKTSQELFDELEKGGAR